MNAASRPIANNPIRFTIMAACFLSQDFGLLETRILTGTRAESIMIVAASHLALVGFGSTMDCIHPPHRLLLKDSTTDAFINRNDNEHKTMVTE
jgi:hypothetical protein